MLKKDENAIAHCNYLKLLVLLVLGRAKKLVLYGTPARVYSVMIHELRGSRKLPTQASLKTDKGRKAVSDVGAMDLPDLALVDGEADGKDVAEGDTETRLDANIQPIGLRKNFRW